MTGSTRVLMAATVMAGASTLLALHSDSVIATEPLDPRRRLPRRRSHRRPSRSSCRRRSRATAGSHSGSTRPRRARSVWPRPTSLVSGKPRNCRRATTDVWEATLGPIDAGAYRYNFNVDGVATIDPRNPAISESNNNVWSLVVRAGLGPVRYEGRPARRGG